MSCVPFLLSALVSSALTQELSLDRVLFTEHGVQYQEEVLSVEVRESNDDSVKSNSGREQSLRM
jgi:hypothetical protein